ncbi:MAG: hypothetical protein PHW18_02060 [Sulfuricurvum sp.]|jgi:hypothetical protein|uniref:hypothetical protein n=1 Tax=Sulfuricurvum sp. TaxID=2025608 RepID=UPI0026398C97|nr:hypothetical protein [Sulfuricurvum sp.]MDD2828340.1 hypothetical protein [Sulfuricurvum sp.]MDD4949345.1 hypothetical protein [Sulfuricurvum sp.]
MDKVRIGLLVMLLMVSSVEARGGGGHHYSGEHYYRGWGYGGWIAPFVFGSMIGYSSRPAVIYEPSPTVVYTTAPQTVVIQNDDGVDLSVNSHYEERMVYFEDCQCERKVLVNTRQ